MAGLCQGDRRLPLREREAVVRGFTLIELMLVIVVLAILAAIATAAYGSHVQQARVARAEEDITQIEAQIELYQSTHGQLPTSLAQIGDASLLDPWGHPYYYLDFTGLSNLSEVRKDRNLVPLNTDYDLFSAGPNGQWVPPITASASLDDIIRADNGAYVGEASDY
jgi:general secretion pathway protein G